MSDTQERPLLEWGSAWTALEGESGDLCTVKLYAGGALAAAIDGLGHGREAAVAARAAATILDAHADAPVLDLLRECHKGIRSTRGVVMSLASFDARATEVMTWAGVGNVDATVFRANRLAAREALTTRGGVVGYQLPPLRALSVPVSAGDVLVMTTDGVHSDYRLDAWRVTDPQLTAQFILDTHGKRTDDALVLVVRYLGRAP